MNLVFKHKKPEAQDIFTFVFLPTKKLSWVAGQSVRLSLSSAIGQIEKRFTISSAPEEKTVNITTRIGPSDFKQSLNALMPGDQVNASAIEGNFVWRKSKLHNVFLAAGIGITPCRAILAHRIINGLDVDATVIYGASHENELAFKGQLEGWQKLHPELRVVFSVGQRLTAGFISQHCQIDSSLFYLSGPSQMVDELKLEMQHKYNLSNERFIIDQFTGLQ